ncbi:multidrug efflux RND transporter permease subunit [Halioxenophilus aromaticivorans]|uniref:MdtB/MuxB family multidrug efflux RND transporter permease subunit n=1 Tax=Halioxenophilus aromaticivorans TaxID=1306992 RepID=A0AAV3U6P2_9ALTE
MSQFSRPFILRPVATSLLMLAMLITGLMTWRMLPVAALPQVDYPIIQIYTFQPGAGPDVTERTITAPLERYLGQIPGLKQMSSTSSAGASVITLQFELDVEMGVAEQEVQAAMNTAQNLLPSDLPAPPIYRKVNPADTPILTLAITSSSMPLYQVHDLVDTRMAQKLAQVSGVGLVSLAGGQRPALRVQVNPTALASYGLSLDQIRQAIASTNANQAKGSFDGPTRTTNLDANDQIRSVEDYKQLIINWENNAALRLGDVANIVDGAEDRFLAAWANGQPAVLLNIQRQPGANVIDVTDRVKELLPELTATLPLAIDVAVLTDRTHSIRASVHDTQKELLFAIGLVVLVTFLFLRSPSATIIPSVAVPLSLIGTFAVMYALGFSINNLTLMALTIATGFVVDDAIVMLENVARHREAGHSPMAAALKGAAEIGFTLISLTFSLVAVLIPLLFMPDVVGRLFHEFAITLAVAIFISLIISLTLTPMMCARFMNTPPQEKSDGFLNRIIKRYDTGLAWVLNHQRSAMLVLLATVFLTGWLYWLVEKDFFPVQDNNVIQVITEAPQNISFTAMAQRQQELAAALMEDPGIESLSSFIGVDGVNTTLNSGRLLINVPPHAQRSESIFTVIERLESRANEIDGIDAYFQPVQELTIEDRVSRTQYQLSLTSLDRDELRNWVPKFVDALNAQPELVDVASDLQQQGAEVYVDIDRDAAARLNLDVTDIADTLYNAFGQRQVTTLFTQASQYRVIMEVDPRFADNPESLRSLFVTNGDGSAIPLANVAEIKQRRAALLINHQSQFPATMVSFNLAPDVALGQAVKAIETVQTQLQKPAIIDSEFQGAAATFQRSLANTLWLILAAVVTMYIVLGVLYESTIHPITILSTLPSATVGALLALLISGRPLDMISVVGIVLLIGLVKKNGIMMVDFALQAQRNQGLTPREAIHQAALLRFRPILMTTLAALFGALPLMLASGSGAELRQPLGIVMVGGLLVSQVLTLFTTPVVYLFFDRFSQSNATTANPAEATL